MITKSGYMDRLCIFIFRQKWQNRLRTLARDKTINLNNVKKNNKKKIQQMNRKSNLSVTIKKNDSQFIFLNLRVRQ